MLFLGHYISTSSTVCFLFIALAMPAIVHALSYIAAEDEAFYEAYVDGGQTGDWSDQVRHRFPNRQMNLPNAEEEEVPMEVSLKSFALFNLNGSANKAYFGAFQISRKEGKF